MLAMSAARIGETDQAVNWLLDDLFEFDDVGMPIGESLDRYCLIVSDAR